jgi:hypothetical protein
MEVKKARTEPTRNREAMSILQRAEAANRDGA